MERGGSSKAVSRSRCSFCRANVDNFAVAFAAIRIPSPSRPCQPFRYRLAQTGSAKSPGNSEQRNACGAPRRFIITTNRPRPRYVLDLFFPNRQQLSSTHTNTTHTSLSLSFLHASACILYRHQVNQCLATCPCVLCRLLDLTTLFSTILPTILLLLLEAVNKTDPSQPSSFSPKLLLEVASHHATFTYPNIHPFTPTFLYLPLESSSSRYLTSGDKPRCRELARKQACRRSSRSTHHVAHEKPRLRQPQHPAHRKE